MIKKINGSDIYVFLWMIYMLQDILYSSGIINRIIQLIMMVWLVVVTAKCLTNRNNSPILRSTIFLVLMYCVYGVWDIIFGSAAITSSGTAISNYIYLQNSLNSLLPIFLFYYYTKKGKIDSNRMRIYVLVILATCISCYYRYESYAMSKWGNSENVNNMSYMFISVIPLLFVYNKRIVLQFLFLCLIMFYTFIGMKRGAIAIGFVAMMIMMYSIVKGSRPQKRVVIILGIVLFIIYMFILVTTLVNNSDLFVSRIEQTISGDSSDRDTLYGKFWNIIAEETNPIYFIFGHGANSTVRIEGAYAHQDWLETLVNNGLLGKILLFNFYFTLCVTALKQRKRFPVIMYYSFLSITFILLSKTMFSMSIQGMYMYEGLLIGYFAYHSSRHNDLLIKNV